MSSKLDNYTVLNMIGKGGMATVYRAVQKSLDRTVALKELDLSPVPILSRPRLSAFGSKPKRQLPLSTQE